MIGRVCSIFPGHTLDSCLDLGVSQLKLLFGESWRQEARVRLREIGNLLISRYGKEDYEQAMVGIRYQAYPPDPEEDGDMTDEQIRKVKAAFMAQSALEESIKKGKN
jgi:hypothetical protein